MTPPRSPARRLRAAVAGAAVLAALAPASALAEPVGDPFNAGAYYGYGLTFNEATGRAVIAGATNTGDGHYAFLDGSGPLSESAEYPDSWTESFSSDVAANAATGDHLVVFTRSRGVHGMLVDAEGEQSEPFTIASRGTRPAVALDPRAQQYLVAWVDAGVIRAKRVSAAGAPLGSGVSRVSDRTSANAAPDVAARPGGGWLAVWQTAKGDATEVVGQDVAPSGEDRGPDDFAVSSHRNLAGRSQNAEPAVAVDARGGALVAFSDTYEVYAQRVSAANARVGAGVRVSSMGPDGSRVHEAHGPSVAFHPRAGSYLVAWAGNDTAPLTAGGLTPKDAYGQHLSASAAPVGADDCRLSTVSETDLGAETEVVADPRGREFIATWLDTYPDHNGDEGTFVRRVLAP